MSWNSKVWMVSQTIAKNSRFGDRFGHFVVFCVGVGGEYAKFQMYGNVILTTCITRRNQGHCLKKNVGQLGPTSEKSSVRHTASAPGQTRKGWLKGMLGLQPASRTKMFEIQKVWMPSKTDAKTDGLVFVFGTFICFAGCGTQRFKWTEMMV